MEMETLTEDARGSLRDGERNEVCELTNWMRGICGGCGYSSLQEGFNFVDSYGFWAKLVRTRRAGFSVELDSVFHKIVSVSIVPRSS